MYLGYARVSTEDQDLALQKEALKVAGVEKIFEEKVSGAKFERKQLARLLDQLGKGDTVVVWKLDRLARSLFDLISIIKKITSKEASFQSLTEAIDLSTPAGRMHLHILGAFAEFEKAMNTERTKEGLRVARKQGRIGGRPSKLSADQRQEVEAMIRAGHSKAEIARQFRVHRTTIGRLSGE